MQLKILLLESSADLRHIVSSKLRQHGHEVLMFDQPDHAVDHLERQDYSAVVCGPNFPRLEQIRSAAASRPFFFLTVTSADIDHILAMGSLKDSESLFHLPAGLGNSVSALEAAAWRGEA